MIYSQIYHLPTALPFYFWLAIVILINGLILFLYYLKQALAKQELPYLILQQAKISYRQNHLDNWQINQFLRAIAAYHKQLDQAQSHGQKWQSWLKHNLPQNLIKDLGPLLTDAALYRQAKVKIEGRLAKAFLKALARLSKKI